MEMNFTYEKKNSVTTQLILHRREVFPIGGKGKKMPKRGTDSNFSRESCVPPK